MIDYYDISETWHPTNVLGTKGGVLYQQWRRRLTKFEQWPGASRPMLSHSIEYEWRTIAEIEPREQSLARQAAQIAQETSPVQPNPNTGHGHVRPRPDGVKARCGGPGICAECSREAAQNR